MRLIVAVAEDLDVQPIELLGAIAWAIVAIPFICGIVVGFLVAGVTA